MENERKHNNRITIVLRKDKDGNQEPITEFIKRMSLVVRTALDKNESVVLEGRGRYISPACELAMSRNLQGAVLVENPVIGVENVTFPNGNKKTIRMANICITLKRKQLA